MLQREQKVARVRLEDGKVLLISNLVITQRYLHPDYLCMPGPGAVAESGLVTVVELMQKDEGIPSFTARWDGSRAGRRPLDLEIDISGVPIGVIRKFKNNMDGYNTSHVDNSPDAGRRLYEVRIETPNGLIFDADIAFFTTYEPAAHPGADMSAALNTAVQRAETLARAPDRPVEQSEALRAAKNPPAVAWLQDKIRSCFAFLSNRLH